MFCKYKDPEDTIYEVLSKSDEGPIRIREWIVKRRTEVFMKGVHSIKYDCVSTDAIIVNNKLTSNVEYMEISHVDLVCSDYYFATLSDAFTAYSDDECSDPEDDE